jgi:hypothetical protein
MQVGGHSEMEHQPPRSDDLAAWCVRWLSAAPARLLFETSHLSQVTGLQLADGRQVVVKVRPPAGRLMACVAVQQHLWTTGFPCPQPLAGPAPLGTLSATAEAFVSGGTQFPRGPDTPQRFAAPLADLVRRATPIVSPSGLAPVPPWVGWDHDQGIIWPMPDDRDADLNAQPGPGWLDDVGRRVRHRLSRDRGAMVVGHADWESQNLRWQDGRLRVVHDWDSVAARSEAAIAGAAAAMFTATGAPLTEATTDETAAFLAAYEQARGRPWQTDERQVCWAAGLWVRAFNAKKAMLDREGQAVVDRLAGEAVERLRRADA